LGSVRRRDVAAEGGEAMKDRLDMLPERMPVSDVDMMERVTHAVEMHGGNLLIREAELCEAKARRIRADVEVNKSQEALETARMAYHREKNELENAQADLARLQVTLALEKDSPEAA
jgi:hypothetical protein